MDISFDLLSNAEKIAVLSKPHIMIEAPAGFGKTHTICECIELLPDDQTQLILTHTHAGIASLQQKLKSRGVPHHKYSIETITGLAQRVVLSFLMNKPTYNQNDGTNYFPYIIQTATAIMDSCLVKSMFTCNFDGMFVDEYQDCTNDMHNFLMKFINLFPIRVLGDELQGIFNFRNNKTVDFSQLKKIEKYQLSTPWRWRIDGNNRKLGEWILHARKALTNKSNCINIPFGNYESYGVYCYATQGWQEKIGLIKQFLSDAEKEEMSILILTSTFLNANKRAQLKAVIDQRNSIALIEPFDEQSYYQTTLSIDNIVNRQTCEPHSFIKILSELSFTSKSINEWFNKSGNLIQKRQRTPLCDTFSTMTSEIHSNPSYKNIYDFLNFFRFTAKGKCLRHNLFHQVIKSLDLAHQNGTTALEEMTTLKNKERRMGRKAEMANIGTTLLTKGLEYDIVIIANSEELKDRNNFYVAISRACKKLYILSTENGFSVM